MLEFNIVVFLRNSDGLGHNNLRRVSALAVFAVDFGLQIVFAELYCCSEEIKGEKKISD